MSGTVDERCRKKEMPDGGADNMRCWEEESVGRWNGQYKMLGEKGIGRRDERYEMPRE